MLTLRCTHIKNKKRYWENTYKINLFYIEGILFFLLQCQVTYLSPVGLHRCRVGYCRWICEFSQSVTQKNRANHRACRKCCHWAADSETKCHSTPTETIASIKTNKLVLSSRSRNQHIKQIFANKQANISLPSYYFVSENKQNSSLKLFFRLTCIM